jgi:hypothetical protein
MKLEKILKIVMMASISIAIVSLLTAIIYVMCG